MPTQALYYSNTAVPAQLGNGISNSATSLYLNLTPSGYPASYPFRLVLAPNGAVNPGQTPEVVHVTGGSGTQASPWTVLRGQDGTTASSWSAGAAVQHEATAGDFTLSRLHEGSVQADLPHGLPAAAWLSGTVSRLFSQVLSAAAASVAITAIPATYSHLVLVAQVRCDEAVNSDYLYCAVNGDAANNYSWDDSGGTHFSTTPWALGRIAGASLSSPAAGGIFALFPNYSGSTFNKMFFALGGAGNITNVLPSLITGFYTPSSQVAINSLTLSPPAGSNFLTGSYFGLYGLL